MDTKREAAAIHRRVTDDERDGKPARAVTCSRQYPTQIIELWEMLTSAERLARWFAPVTGDLRTGGQYQVEGNASGTITACEAPTFLAVTWEFRGDVSWLELRLSGAGEGTTLELTHIQHPGDHWRQFGPAATGTGWDLALYGLARHLASAGAFGAAEGAAWAESEEGFAFVRASGEAWYAADAASGTPPEVARAAADRTISFYTGGE